MIRWKFVSAVAILAMVVSLLSGGLSGIGFGVLIFRALLGGLIFAGFAVGLNLLVVRVFPELLEGDEVSESESDGSGDIPGQRVDILMPAEEPESFVRENGEVVSGVRPAVDGLDNIRSVDEVQTDGLDATGDLDSFAGAFSETESEAGSTNPSKENALGVNQEPEELAQAIQTVMKRDEKG